jgi:hypothetical protein
MKKKRRQNERSKILYSGVFFHRIKFQSSVLLDAVHKTCGEEIWSSAALERNSAKGREFAKGKRSNFAPP